MGKYSRQVHLIPRRVFKTGRFTIRPLSEEHEEGMWEMFSDPEFVKYVPFPLQTDREKARETYLAQIREGERFKFHFAVEWRETGKMAGFAMVRPTGDGKNMEIGYCVTRKDWGKGLGSEITRFLIEEIAPLMGAKKADLLAKIRPENVASIRVAEKCGFKIERQIEEEDGPQLILKYKG